MVASKKKEIEALTKAIESKTGRIGELGVKVAQEENDLEDCQISCGSSYCRSMIGGSGTHVMFTRDCWVLLQGGALISTPYTFGRVRLCEGTGLVPDG